MKKEALLTIVIQKEKIDLLILVLYQVNMETKQKKDTIKNKKADTMFNQMKIQPTLLTMEMN